MTPKRRARRSRLPTSSQRGWATRCAYATSKLGLLADADERYGDAMRLHMEANELFAGVGDLGGAGYALSRASLSAYGMEEYEEALRLGRAGYEAFSEVNQVGQDRRPLPDRLCRAGPRRRRRGAADVPRRARAAHDSAAISLELLALSGAGAVLREKGEREQAATLLTFALGHEQLPPSYGFAARPALEALEAELPRAARRRPARGIRGTPRRTSSRGPSRAGHRAPFLRLRAWPPRLSLDRAPPKPIWLPSTSR